jgi:tetratricopeptide (TPR) repeat protein
LRRLIVEKLPFLTLAAASCLVTLWAQAAAIAPTAVVPWVSRLANAPIAYFEYLGKFFWPADLAVFYPHPPTPPAWRPLAAVLGLAGLSTAAWLGRRTQPWLLVGWLWYLGMLVPVIGIVQVGSQGMADRYTYLPEIGLAIAIVWAASTALRSPTRKRGNLPIVAAVAILLAVLMAMSWRQTSYWRSSEALWTRALDCTGDDNVVAHINLGWALKDQGRLGEAIEQYRRALEIRPDSAEARNKLGVALALQGKLDEALAEFILAVKFDPQNAGFRANLERARAMSQAAGAGHAAPAESRPR